MIIERLQLGHVPENPTNVWLIENMNTGQAVIIDPADDAGRIIEHLSQLGQTLAGILLTHGHFDHIMAADALREYYRIPIYAGIREKELLSDPEMNQTVRVEKGGRSVVPDVFVQDRETISLAGFLFQVIATPGHTAGSCCYYLKKQGRLFSGDTIFKGRHGRTDLVTGSETAMMDSVKNRLMLLPPETVVYTGHGEKSTIEEERRVYD